MSFGRRKTMARSTAKIGSQVVGACIATRLRLATRVITKLYDDALRPFGLTVAQMALLAVAAESEGLRQVGVRARLQLDDSTLSRNLERMRAKGWMVQVEEEDARVHSHELTEAGAALLEKATPAWQEAQRAAGSMLGESGVAALRRFARMYGFND